jgi:hypothetical protein
VERFIKLRKGGDYGWKENRKNQQPKRQARRKAKLRRKATPKRKWVDH